ncbi:zinc transporter ZIP1-like [Asterias rubens]|uniref:zinc transporter ZIP1-like n=1 Tax=Asterias rubens TaxID=7604 RepID=UPI0014557D6F|nr:zinc transporter ZIP1-like [Asterias rubens]XP_033634011.1 zinc transporter ZIP1-like [Asterias rubens]
MEILIIKFILLGTLFVTCLTASLLPLKFVDVFNKRQGQAGLARKHLMERVFRFLNCFGGGVFLATCLLDLLPDVRSKLTDLFPKLGIKTNFPIAEFITAVGLFLILCIEQIAHDFKEKSFEKKHHKALQQIDEEEQPEDERSPLLKHTATSSAAVDNQVNTEQHNNPSSQETLQRELSNTGSVQSEGHGHSHGHSHGMIDSNPADSTIVQHTDSHDMVTSSSLRSLLLLLALSLHSLFEGLALGLQSNIAQLLGIFSAIVIHKTILALSLGVNFVQSNLHKATVIQSSICFSVMAPIGIVIGVLVTEGFNSIAHGITSGVLQGLATGTFLYITFFEVLPMEMSQPGDRLLKLLSTLIGFSVIVGTLFLDPTINSGN